MEEIIASVVLFLMAVIFIALSILSFFEKGFLFNNAYIYASKEERKYINKKPHYRQTAITFLLIGIAFLLNGVACLFALEWIYAVSVTLIVATIIYAVVSSVRNS